MGAANKYSQRDKDELEYALALSKLERLERLIDFDPAIPGSRPTIDQQKVIDDVLNDKYRHFYITSGNQGGKTRTAVRILSWIFLEDETVPFKRPKRWGTEPLKMMLCSVTNKLIEDNILSKLLDYLPEDCYHLSRMGGILQKMTNKKNGNHIIFNSHHNAYADEKKAQGFTCHVVICDELPDDSKYIKQLHRRLQVNGGYFICPFTPIRPDPETQAMIDNSRAPLAHIYRFNALDNPHMSQNERELAIAAMELMTPEEKDAAMYGKWLTHNTNLYQVDPARVVRKPEGYSNAWRHIEICDPANSTKFGWMLMAEDPHSGQWYVVQEEAIEGAIIKVPSDIVAEIKRRTLPYNIVKRICDPGYGAWYRNQAAKEGMRYEAPFDKGSRLGVMRKNLQQKLGVTVFFAPWCEASLREIMSIRSSEKNPEKLVNPHKYHLHDCIVYGVDCLPKQDHVSSEQQFDSYQHMLRVKNKERLEAEAAAQKGKEQFGSSKKDRSGPIRIRCYSRF